MRPQNDNERCLALRLSHVALPDDAVDCEPWEWQANQWRRFFTVKEWNVGNVWVCVSGQQSHHGDVTRWVHVGGEDQCTKSDRHRLTDALADAGKLLDSLS